MKAVRGIGQGRYGEQKDLTADGFDKKCDWDGISDNLVSPCNSDTVKKSDSHFMQLNGSNKYEPTLVKGDRISNPRTGTPILNFR